jgi:hypothetical protein
MDMGKGQGPNGPLRKEKIAQKPGMTALERFEAIETQRRLNADEEANNNMARRSNSNGIKRSVSMQMSFLKHGRFKGWVPVADECSICQETFTANREMCELDCAQ